MQNLHICKICVYANLGHVNTALDRSKSGALDRDIIFKRAVSYLSGRLYRNRSGHMKLTNRGQAGLIVSERMDSQLLVSKLKMGGALA